MWWSYEACGKAGQQVVVKALGRGGGGRGGGGRGGGAQMYLDLAISDSPAHDQII